MIDETLRSLQRTFQVQDPNLLRPSQVMRSLFARVVEYLSATGRAYGDRAVRPHNPVPMALFQAGMNRAEVRAATGFAPSMVDRYYRRYLKWRDAQVYGRSSAEHALRKV